MEILNRLLEQIRDVRPESIVYIDETGTDTFCTKNTLIPSAEKKLLGEFPVGNIGVWVLSPFQFNGTMDGGLFEFWFENCFLRECPSNSVIVMDNAAFHRKKRLFRLPKAINIKYCSYRRIPRNITLLRNFGHG
jgi:hypothetical protein